MWIVSFALRRPLSVSVMALLMLVLGALAFTRMNADIFPAIDMPVVIVVWGYPGLSAIDMERRVVIISERAMSTTVNDIEHMESESIAGAGIVRVYFHPGTTTAAGIAQIGAMSQALGALESCRCCQRLFGRWPKSPVVPPASAKLANRASDHMFITTRLER